MAITRGDLKDKVLRLLNRSSTYNGAYTDEKMDDAIEDCLDYLSVEMAIANEGWNTKFFYYSPAAGDKEVTIDVDDIMLINQVRYLAGDEYIPLIYDQNRGGVNTTSSSGYTQFPSRYRIVENKIYFDPGLGEGGTNYLQVEATEYPDAIASDATNLPAHFDKAMQHFIKFRSASYLASSVGKFNKEWSSQEQQWYNQIIKIVNKRNNVEMTIREFNG